jgi:DNA-binding NarL/FixJ family response regulator
MLERARVLLADDHPDLLRALRRLLDSSYAVVGAVQTGAQALEAVGRLAPDVIVIDVSLPDMDGLEICRRVRGIAPHAHVVILTAADDPEVEQRAFALGAFGFVRKYRVGEDLVPAIERAWLGKRESAEPQ